VEHGFAGACGSFVVLIIATTASQPGKRAFDNPAFRQHHEASDADRPQHRLQNPTKRGTHPIGQATASIGRIGKQNLQSSKALAHLFEQQPSAILILHIGAMHHHGQDQSQGVDCQMSFAAGDLFAGIVATNSADFRGFLRFWLSRIAARGLALRPSARRTCSRSVS